MGDATFPGQHTTTTTTTTTTGSGTTIYFNKGYLRTLPGILKCAQVLFSLLGFICIQISRYSSLSKGSYFSVIAMIAFWFTGILLLLYLFNFVYKFQKIPWTKMEFLFCALWSLLYLIAAALATSVYDNPYAAAAFFGFAAMLMYAIDAFLKWRNIHVVVVVKEVTVVNTPAREGY